MDFLVGVAALAVNILVWVWIINLYDNQRPEPISGLIFAIAIGGMLSTIYTFWAGSAIYDKLGLASIDERSQWWLLLIKLFVAVTMEETAKLLAFLYVISKEKYIKEPIDCMVYAMAVGLGFAAIENSLYMFEQGVGSIVIRSIISMPFHILYGGLIGYGYAQAKYLENSLSYYEMELENKWQGQQGAMLKIRWGKSVYNFLDLLFSKRHFMPYYIAAILAHVLQNILSTYRIVYFIIALIVYLIGLAVFVHTRLRFLGRQSPFINLTICPNCTAPIGPFYDVCKVCGAVLLRDYYRFCQQCGKQAMKADGVCRNCGTILE
jgi:RsiW-degrading membrane proteinase PrsW (M82 family)